MICISGLKSFKLLHNLIQIVIKDIIICVTLINKEIKINNSRSPFHWSDTENAGFTTGKPWIKVSSDYRRFNAQDEAEREDSVLNFYKKAIALRKETPALVYGEFIRAEGINICIHSLNIIYFLNGFKINISH